MYSLLCCFSTTSACEVLPVASSPPTGLLPVTDVGVAAGCCVIWKSGGDQTAALFLHKQQERKDNIKTARYKRVAYTGIFTHK